MIMVDIVDRQLRVLFERGDCAYSLIGADLKLLGEGKVVGVSGGCVFCKNKVGLWCFEDGKKAFLDADWASDKYYVREGILYENELGKVCEVDGEVFEGFSFNNVVVLKAWECIVSIDATKKEKEYVGIADLFACFYAKELEIGMIAYKDKDGMFVKYTSNWLDFGPPVGIECVLVRPSTRFFKGTWNGGEDVSLDMWWAICCKLEELL